MDRNLEQMNGWGFRPLFYTYRLNCARGTSRVWVEESENTAVQKQGIQKSLLSEAEHTTSLSQRLSTILNLYWLSNQGRYIYTNEAEKANYDINDFKLRKPSHSWFIWIYISTLQWLTLRTPIQFEFSVTWSCVSLPQSTTSSDWKFVLFVEFRSQQKYQCFKIARTFYFEQLVMQVPIKTL